MQLKNYWKPTPKWARQLGDSLLAAGTLASSSAIIADYKTAGLIALGLSVIGKFLSNLFANVGED